MNKNVTGITPEALDLLVRYNWPGNVRELENAIERAMVVSKGPSIGVDHLPFQLTSETEAPKSDSLEDIEKAHIARVLSKVEWNITRAAETLKIDRVTLYNKIKKYELNKDNSFQQK